MLRLRNLAGLDDDSKRTSGETTRAESAGIDVGASQLNNRLVSRS